MKIVNNLKIDLDWHLVQQISNIDRFDASWSSIEKIQGENLKQLKAIATVRSVGASTRIEGSLMSNEEVDVLLKNLSVDKLVDRDSQEVAGYFNVLELISDAFEDIFISEGTIKNLHGILMKFNDKDQWHRGNYKQHTNSVEAVLANGAKQIIFQTTPPGFETENAMRQLIEWYINDKETHALVKSAVFCYEFVSIHPFQDGNGRLSRLLATLLLLKNGYTWIQYVSFEHEIEHKKIEYYKVLRQCQAQRPNENISSWIAFFLNSLSNIQQQLEEKLLAQKQNSTLSATQQSVLSVINNYGSAKSGEIAEKLDVSLPTVKRILSELVNMQLIERVGKGRGTRYLVK